MNQFFSILIVVAGFCGLIAVINLYSNWTDPLSRGDAAYRPSVELQKKSHKARKPKQGSSKFETGGSGYLYLISNPTFKALKIGISNSASQKDRLADHVQYGWVVESLWTFGNFRNAEQVEGAVIAWWRNALRAPHACIASQMPQGGYTETVSLSRVSISTTTAFVEDLVAQTDGKRAIEVPIAKLLAGAAMSVTATIKYVEKGTRTSAYRTISRRGNRYWNRQEHRWQRWVIEDATGQLLLEFNQGSSIPIRDIKIGSTVRVTGRVEKITGAKRMTNPVFEIIAVGNRGKAPRSKISNQNFSSGNKLTTKKRSSTDSIASRSGVATPSTTSVPKIRTAFEERMRNEHTISEALAGSLLAERCSSCGALVHNGSAHDC